MYSTCISSLELTLPDTLKHVSLSLILRVIYMWSVDICYVFCVIGLCKVPINCPMQTAKSIRLWMLILMAFQ